MRRAVLLALLLVALPVASLRAQGTGSIAGRITDDAGKPLSGMQVSVVGTRLGVLSNAEGRYAIAGVTPGSTSAKSWQYATSATGNLTFSTSGLSAGSYVAYYLYNDGYQAYRYDDRGHRGYGRDGYGRDGYGRDGGRVIYETPDRDRDRYYPY